MIPFIIGGLIAGAVIAVLMLKYKDILNTFIENSKEFVLKMK